MCSLSLLDDKKLIIASYTHIIKGKYTTIGGPGLALKGYLQKRTKKLMCVWQPMLVSDTLSIIIEIFEREKDPKTFKLPVINCPFGRKKTISLLYVLLKIRDIFSVFISYLFSPGKYDIFIGVEALDALLGVTMRSLGLVRKVVYYSLDYGIKRFDIRLLNWSFHFLDKLAVNSSDITWSLCEETLIQRRNKGIVSKEEGHSQIVVPIGVNFRQIERLPTEAIDRKAIVYLGVLQKLQGVQLLIEAFAEILKKMPGVSLTIIGSGDFEANLKQMVKELNLEGCIKFTGTISDEEARQVLCKCAIGVAPYYLDDPYSNTRFTEPTKPKTYLSCGLPVIITRVSKIALDIDKAKAGIAIDYNKTELIEALSKLLSDDVLYRQYRHNAIAFVAQYDWKNIFDNAFRSFFNEYGSSNNTDL